MNDKDIPTEEKVDSAIELYTHDSRDWDCEILLDELEHLYKWREMINKIILRFKLDIKVGLARG